jgi:hypothetical protein
MNPPKPKQKSFFSDLLFVFSLLTLFAAVGGFFAFNYLIGQRQTQYDDLSAQLAREITPEQKALESIVLGYRQRLQDFPLLLNSHTSPSRFFLALEKITYPQIYFSGIALNPLDMTAVIEGKAASFDSLSRQAIIFNNSDEVFDSVALSKVSLAANGNIEFSFNANINNEIILYK